MDNAAEIIVTIGSILLAGLAMDFLASKVKLPRVTFLLVLGVFIGPSVFNIIPDHITVQWFPILTKISLAMIAFIIGSKLTFFSLRRIGKPVFVISLSIVLITLLCVFLGLYTFQVSIPVALILAGLSTATAPTTTYDVVLEAKVDNSFTHMLLGITAIDSAWCLIAFSFVMALVDLYHGQYADVIHVIFSFSWEIGGAILLGILLGIPAAYLSGRIQPGRPTLTEAIGIVFFASGIALYLQVSFILTLIVLGIIVGQFGKHHKREFHAIEGVEWPFMVIFFILAGASLEIKMLIASGFVGVVYIISRVVGRVLSCWLGAAIVNTDNLIKKWMGLALTPQAGLSIGLALIAIHTYPEYKNQILPVVLGSTIVLEILGPVLTRKAVLKAGAQ